MYGSGRTCCGLGTENCGSLLYATSWGEGAQEKGPKPRYSFPIDLEAFPPHQREVSEVLCLGAGLFFFNPLRFCQGAVGPQQFPPSRGVMGARSPHSKGVSLIC